MSKELSVILFDLGGVLVELPPRPIPAGWADHALPSEQRLSGWLSSTAAKAFEKGQISTAQFADKLVNEMKLSIAPEEIIAYFTLWPKGFFPGTMALIGRIRPHSGMSLMACLANPLKFCF